jgi:hypothetical protein
MRTHLQGLLETRLKLEHQDAKGQGNLSPVSRPVFITGMPRSGSTFLHELLMQEHALRAPCVWEVLSATTASRPDRGWSDSRVWRTALCLWFFRLLVPGADTVYPMRARTPQECVAIHSHTFLSEEFNSSCFIPSYANFLRSTDLSPAYAWQKRFLQRLQCNRPEARWVLKSPDHARSMEALFAVFPDALVIHTHRNPLESLRSTIHLTEVLRRLYARPQNLETLAECEAQNLAFGAARIMQFRDNHPELANHFVDVNYSELAANPLATVRRVLRHFDIPLPTEAVRRIERMSRCRSAYKGRRAARSLTDMGLDMGSCKSLFSDYCRRFGISFGRAGVNQAQ